MKYFLSFILTISCFFCFSQDYNLNLLGNLDYADDGSDIWGYVDNQGTEYAVMGINDGTVIISLADPTNPVEVAFIDGGNSDWRDMKTYGNYAYVTTEAPDGLLVINLTDVALGIVTHYFYQPGFNNSIIQGQLQTIHNLYIDENGFCYLSGSNLNNGGVLILDLNQDPENPPLVGKGEAIYSHDVYVRNDTCWSSNVNDGHFSAIDVSDKANPVTLAYQETSFTFSHNAWLSDSGQFLFTTDELPNANIDAYDVSDVNNITRVDTWVPPTTAGTNVIPHNVHVHNDYLVISYYTDGVKIVDAHRPSNLVEVGSYDTYSGPMGDGFLGCWGAYPFLPSGRVLASDIGLGLLVFEPTYVRACYLEGLVTDANTGLPLNGVNISVSSGLSETTPADGEYATGQVDPGIFQATYTKLGYLPQTLDVTLVNGQVTIQNVALIPDIPVSITGQVVDASNNGIANASVRIQSIDLSAETTADANGNYSFNNVFQNEYEIYAGMWGYTTEVENLTVTSTSNNNVVIALEEGYEDPFAVDLGWTESGDATAGEWELGEPIGTNFDGADFNPDFDVVGDVGDWCYVTGNNGGDAGTDDVDGGVTTLLSPIFDLSTYNDPYLAYQVWFMNGGGNGDPNDQLTVSILNGANEVVIETIDENTNDWNTLVELKISDFITPTATMQFKVETSDFAGTGHLVEAGLDNFYVNDGPSFQTLTGTVLDQATNIGIANAPVRIQGESSTYSSTTDSNGNFTITSIFPDEYDIYAGIWGYSTETTTANIIEGNPNSVILELTEGYQDPFALDLGWTESGSAVSGQWELGEPIGTIFDNAPFAPEEDVTGDIGDWCYVTGNTGGGAGNDDVDDGMTTLTSPAFDLSTYVDPHLSYQALFLNDGGSGNPDDEMVISIISDNTEVVIETITASDTEWSAVNDIRILDYVPLSNIMLLKVSASDLTTGAGHLVEAGFDNFIIYDDLTSVPVNELENIVLEIAPNPFHSSIRITIPESLEEGNIEIYDVLGRMISQTSFTNEQNIDLNTENWSPGIYQVVLATDNGRISQKIIKR